VPKEFFYQNWQIDEVMIKRKTPDSGRGFYLNSHQIKPVSSCIFLRIRFLNINSGYNQLLTKTPLIMSERNRITRDKAEELIQEYRELNEIIIRSVNMTEPDAHKRARAKVMKDKDCNAFIFEKEDILRFFDGSEGEKADHLMVVLAAHDENETDPDFPPGSFTVVSAGCNKLTKDDSGKVIYRSLSIPKPANEYPPKLVRTTLDTKDADDPIDFIVEE